MPDLYENKNPTLFSQSCDVSTGVFEPYIDSRKALSVSTPCDNPIRKNMPTCKDSEKDIFLNEVSGLSLNLRLPKIKVDLPSFIPILDNRTARLSSFAIPSGVTTVSLTIGDVISKGVVFKAGMWHEQDEIKFRVNLLSGNIFKGKKIILLNSGTDTLIEWLWYRRKDIFLYDYLNTMGFSMSTGMNFSVIKGECPFGQALNQKKSLMSAYLSSKKGLPSMPHIYVIDNFDIQKWVEYFKKYPHVQIASMNCQLQKSKIDTDALITGITKIMVAVPNLHLILTGFPITKMCRFGSLLDRIHLANKQASKCAQSHKKIVIDPTTFKMRLVYSPKERISDILYHNINQQRVLVEIIRKRTMEKYKIPDEMVPLIKSVLPNTYI